MQRWTNSALSGLALAFALASVPAHTQTIRREAPKDVKPATIAISATPPIIAVDGQPDRLSPGVRIRDLNNLLVLPATLAGQTVYTVYKRDTAGLVHEVWLLTQDEYVKLGGVNTGEADGWKRFYDLLALIFGARTAWK
jgi:hypothetical protein